MRVLSIPVLADNYAYLVIDENSAIVVDPSQDTPVIDALAREGVTPVAIWLTHHHMDHIGGVEGLLAKYPSLEVFAHASDVSRIPKVSRPLEDGDVIELGGVRAKIIHNPGHTLGAISYWIEAGEGAVFTGDTLFGAGCGRVFEGTPEMMYESLHELAALPETTRVYFGHEYTAANLTFAAHVEPDQPAIAARAAALTVPSTPSTIGDERRTNPFLLARDVGEFARRREAKNSFK